MANPLASHSIRDTIDAESCFRAVLGSALQRDDARGQGGIPLRALDELGWPRITQEIASRCLGDDAQALAAVLGPLPWGPIPLRRRSEVVELARLIQVDDTPPLRGIKAIGRALLRVRKGDVLQGPDLVAIADTIAASERIREYCRTRAQRLPLLNEHTTRLVGLRAVASEIHRSFDPSGEVADTASMELARLRRRVAALRDQIRDRLDRIVRSPRYEGILQDDYITIRDERYVVPVRAGERGDFPGIVHGQSGSGATLFVEPQELIGLNNEFRVAQMDVENEIRRILTALTRLVERNVDALEDNQDILTYLDLTLGCARLSNDLECTAPVLTLPSEENAVDLRRARHPVLALRQLAGELEVVENDVRLAGRTRVLIVSGPNTGGKTVTLKLMGSFAIMTRAGLPVPADDDSRFPLYEQVFSDIGDEQNVERDLSTFSAHLRNIARVLPDCDGGTLLLLDELFAGTDPEQGAALGRALLDELARRGTWVVVTTHLEKLKTLAFEDDAFACASVGFDIDRLEPTYALRMGVPGSSYALRIAARLGLSPRICERAEALLTDSGSTEREGWLDRLQREHQALIEERKELYDTRAKLARTLKDTEQQRTALQKKEREALDAELRTVREELTKLRDVVRKESARLREGGGAPAELPRRLEAARKVAQEVDERQAAIAARLPAAPSAEKRAPIDVARLVPGSRVWVQSFKRVGEVVEKPQPGQRIAVRVGIIQGTFAADELFAPDEAKAAALGSRQAAVVTRTQHADDASTVLDVRGATVDDAVEQLDSFLDRAVRARLFQVSVIHGHGTGALKRAVRGHLASSRYGVDYRAGERGEGGDGVTLVYLEPRRLDGPAEP